MEEAKLFSISPFDFYPIATALADEDEIGIQPVKLVSGSFEYDPTSFEAIEALIGVLK